MPLLSALSHAGYYEDRYWGDQYGDEALDACEDLTGVRTARVVARFLGRWLGLVFGVLFAYVRFRLTPKRERGYPFREMFIQLFGAVTAITGTAALSLDVERAARVANVLEIFSVLPRRFAARGIYEFCLGLREIGREQQATAFETFDGLLEALPGSAAVPRVAARHAAPLRHGRALRPGCVRGVSRRRAAPRSRAPTRSTPRG